MLRNEARMSSLDFAASKQLLWVSVMESLGTLIRSYQSRQPQLYQYCSEFPYRSIHDGAKHLPGISPGPSAVTRLVLYDCHQHLCSRVQTQAGNGLMRPRSPYDSRQQLQWLCVCWSVKCALFLRCIFP